eukprot:152427_1
MTECCFFSLYRAIWLGDTVTESIFAFHGVWQILDSVTTEVEASITGGLKDAAYAACIFAALSIIAAVLLLFAACDIKKERDREQKYAVYKFIWMCATVIVIDIPLLIIPIYVMVETKEPNIWAILSIVFDAIAWICKGAEVALIFIEFWMHIKYAIVGLNGTFSSAWVGFAIYTQESFLIVSGAMYFIFTNFPI